MLIGVTPFEKRLVQYHIKYTHFFVWKVNMGTCFSERLDHIVVTVKCSNVHSRRAITCVDLIDVDVLFVRNERFDIDHIAALCGRQQRWQFGDFK
jgi:hypothetical protein